MQYSLRELASLPTLCKGQADDLKIEEGNYRVWLSRCSEVDGEPFKNKVTIERRIAGCWVETETYQAI